MAAAEICALPGPFCDRVAVFVDPEPEFVRAVLARAGPSCLQFHGGESAGFCRSFGLPYLKALRMRDGIDLQGAAREYGDARGLLLDSYIPGRPGGTGETFAWERARMAGGPPVIIAGGLTAENVAAAIAAAAPYGVDVSGGVEDAPGVKNPGAVHEFCAAVWRADAPPLTAAAL